MSPKKALIYIGGSYLQLPGIRWAKELGLHVVVTDRNPNVPGRAIADRFEVISGEDLSTLLALANEVSSNYDLIGAYGGSDFSLLAVAEIAEAHNLPGPTIRAVRSALDKSVAKQHWLDAGLATPRGFTVTDLDEARNAAIDLGFPVIVKPIDSSGSRGVLTVDGIAGMEQAYIKAREFSSIVLVEKFVQGRQIDVNGLFLNGNFVPCGTDERFFTPLPLRIPLWLYQPADLTPEEEGVCYDLLEAAARSIGIEDGPVKGDLILGERGPVIVELAPRFHGEVLIAYTTPVALGINPVKAHLAALIGLPSVREWLHPREGGVAGWHAIISSPGKVKSVQGIDKVYGVEGVYDLMLRIKPGDVVRSQDNTSSMSGFIWVSRPSIANLQASMNEALKAISIITEE